MVTHFKSVTEYISSFPSEIQKRLEVVRKTIQEELPEAEEVISYNIPAFKQQKSYVIYYSAWKKHISLYPFSSDMEDLLKDPNEYVTSGKGTIQFPHDKPLPLPLIKAITKALLKKNTQRTAKTP